MPLSNDYLNRTGDHRVPKPDVPGDTCGFGFALTGVGGHQRLFSGALGRVWAGPGTRGSPEAEAPYMAFFPSSQPQKPPEMIAACDWAHSFPGWQGRVGRRKKDFLKMHHE